MFAKNSKKKKKFNSGQLKNKKAEAGIRILDSEKKKRFQRLNLGTCVFKKNGLRDFNPRFNISYGIKIPASLPFTYI